MHSKTACGTPSGMILEAPTGSDSAVGTGGMRVANPASSTIETGVGLCSSRAKWLVSSLSDVAATTVARTWPPRYRLVILSCASCGGALWLHVRQNLEAAIILWSCPAP